MANKLLFVLTFSTRIALILAELRGLQGPKSLWSPGGPCWTAAAPGRCHRPLCLQDGCAIGTRRLQMPLRPYHVTNPYAPGGPCKLCSDVHNGRVRGGEPMSPNQGRKRAQRRRRQTVLEATAPGPLTLAHRVCKVHRTPQMALGLSTSGGTDPITL